MCVSTGPAEFSGTKIYLGQTVHPTHGAIYVMGYQNTPWSKRGPNAMLLHIWNSEQMGPGNFLDTTNCPHILHDMVRAVESPSRSATRDPYITKSLGVQIFDVGIYTVVLASKATDISKALPLVAENKRPSISKELLSFYAKYFDGASVALCCFDNELPEVGQPLLFWYKQNWKAGFRFPAIDAHTGDVPDMDEFVDVDHWLIASTPGLHGMKVTYRDYISDEMLPYLPGSVIGRRFGGQWRNGDFYIPQKSIQNGTMGGVERVQPPSLRP